MLPHRERYRYDVTETLPPYFARESSLNVRAAISAETTARAAGDLLSV